MQMAVLSSDAEWLSKRSTFVIDSGRTQKFVDNHNPTITALAITHQATLFRQCLSKERIFWFKNTDLGKDYVGSVSVFFFSNKTGFSTLPLQSWRRRQNACRGSSLA
jgi:hypothetical protein